MILIIKMSDEYIEDIATRKIMTVGAEVVHEIAIYNDGIYQHVYTRYQHKECNILKNIVNDINNTMGFSGALLKYEDSVSSFGNIKKCKVYFEWKMPNYSSKINFKK